MHKIFIVAAFTLTADAPFAVQCRLQTLHLAVLLQVAVQQSKQPLQQAAVGEPLECLCQQQYGSSILLHLDKAAALCRCFGAMTGGSWPTATQHVGLTCCLYHCKVDKQQHNQEHSKLRKTVSKRTGQTKHLLRQSTSTRLQVAPETPLSFLLLLYGLTPSPKTALLWLCCSAVKYSQPAELGHND